jgi:hypothetical protein
MSKPDKPHDRRGLAPRGPLSEADVDAALERATAHARGRRVGHNQQVLSTKEVEESLERIRKQHPGRGQRLKPKL